MRNKNRIPTFVDNFGQLWKDNFPDWRFGQLISNFFGWVYMEKKKDIFFIEEDKMLEYFEEYCNNNK